MDKEKEKKSSKTKNTTNKKTTTSKKDEKVTNQKVTKKEEVKKVSKKEKEEVLTPILEEEYEEYNEDLEEEYEDDFEAEFGEKEIIITKVEKKPVEKKQEKKEKVEKKKEEKSSKEKIEKIEKIEKMAKEKKKNTTVKARNSKLNQGLELFEKHHTAIYSFIGGVLITTLIVFLIWPDRIATLKNGEQPVVKVGKETYTANELYENMKDYYSVSLLLDEIDDDLLTELYPEDEEMTEEINSKAEYYYSMYQQYYNYTEEQFLEENGFSSHEAFLDYLRLDYRRSEYLDDYVEKNLTDDEIQKYYDENVFGDINTQHVLVEVKSDSDSDDSEKLSDEDAKKLAEEIITKLNDGTSWEQIQTDYKDKITYEDLSYQSWDASLEESFMTALKDMDDNSYSDEPVQTSYGYHVIYRLDQKEAPSLKKSKDKIVENLVADKKSEDSNLLYKSLISLREENNITFSDTVMKEKYENYCSQYK